MDGLDFKKCLYLYLGRTEVCTSVDCGGGPKITNSFIFIIRFPVFFLHPCENLVFSFMYSNKLSISFMNKQLRENLEMYRFPFI